MVIGEMTTSAAADNAMELRRRVPLRNNPTDKTAIIGASKSAFALSQIDNPMNTPAAIILIVLGRFQSEMQK